MYTIELWVYRFFVVVVPTLNMLITFSCFQVSNNRCRSYHPLCWLQFFFSLDSIVWILYVLLRVIWSLSYFMFSESSESVVWCPNHFDKFSFIFFKYFFFPILSSPFGIQNYICFRMFDIDSLFLNDLFFSLLIQGLNVRLENFYWCKVKFIFFLL